MLLIKKHSILMFLASLFIWSCSDEIVEPVNDPPKITEPPSTSIDKDELLSGETVTITIEAVDPENDELTYSYELDGTPIPGSDNQTDFIVPTAEGTHKILVKVSDGINEAVENSIEITVCNSVSLGLYSESERCGIVLDQNSFIGLYSGGGAEVIEFEDDPSEKCEGEFGKKMTVNVGSIGEWAGWFIMYGVEGTPDSHTRDCLLFDGGTLRFCIKSEINNLEIGIRSGNVIAGNEHNVLLSELSGFQVNEWIDISIPLVRFTDPPQGKPKADLSQLKILFNVASSQKSGGTNGNQSFWIDNVRLVRSGY